MRDPKRFGGGRAPAVWAGIGGPVLFVSVFTIEGWLRRGYDSSSMYISALSLGPRGWVQILNFVVFGLLLLAFAREVAGGEVSRAGAALLTTVAICYLLVGPFVMDAVGDTVTIHGRIHGAVARIGLVLMPVSCFAFVGGFFRPPQQRFLAWLSVAAGAVVAIAVALLAVATMAASARELFAPWVGLIERVAVVLYMVWVFCFAMTRVNGAA